MNKYLQNREDYYVRANVTVPVGRYPTKLQHLASLKRIRSIKTELQESVDFLSLSKDEIEDSVENYLSAIEAQYQILDNSCHFIAESKFESGLSDGNFEVSVVDISKGQFSNMSYSVKDKGIVLNSINRLKIS